MPDSTQNQSDILILAEKLIQALDTDNELSDKEEAATAMQNAEVIMIENSMHGTPFDQTELFNQVVLDFLLKRN